ncbi:hypothetical protein DCC35_13690 [Mangrovivirga cuniculi]|uniref:DUF3953 domain-containing protein n=1 Tax=Mangrovivirga cuniculi TaxID=2715131 RepID=A0A4D7JJE7_9BACT|nr:hypothetical protein DCC35_13690 [Mangrovivirga cuniculi]
MIKILKFTPFILLILYFTFIHKLDISWNVKLSIMATMIMVSIISLFQIRKKYNSKKSIYILAFGILSVLLTSINFTILP